MWDEDLRPVPRGEVGEIVVRTRFLGPGYWNRPDITQDRFVPDPDLPGQRVYRTGDLGRMLPDGCLMHLGRIDQQVKIRGHRVEVLEVESLLNGMPDVREVVVLPVDEPNGGQSWLPMVPAVGRKD